jgi:hypothetical protein
MQNKRKSSVSKAPAKGVSFVSHKSGYRARIKANGKHYMLGYFKTVEEASAAYKAAAIEHFGEFARAE